MSSPVSSLQETGRVVGMGILAVGDEKLLELAEVETKISVVLKVSGMTVVEGWKSISEVTDNITSSDDSIIEVEKVDLVGVVISFVGVDEMQLTTQKCIYMQCYPMVLLL